MPGITGRLHGANCQQLTFNCYTLKWQCHSWPSCIGAIIITHPEGTLPIVPSKGIQGTSTHTSIAHVAFILIQSLYILNTRKHVNRNGVFLLLNIFCVKDHEAEMNSLTPHDKKGYMATALPSNVNWAYFFLPALALWIEPMRAVGT